MHVASDLYYFNIVNLHSDKTRIFGECCYPRPVLSQKPARASVPHLGLLMNDDVLEVDRNLISHRGTTN